VPIECELLEYRREPFGVCPQCGRIFESLMRGQVQRSKHPWLGLLFWINRAYCAVICRRCKEIVGWEAP
jgi:ribosomal protein L34E